MFFQTSILRPLLAKASSLLSSTTTASYKVPYLSYRSTHLHRNSPRKAAFSYGFATLATTEKRLMKRDLLYQNILITIKGFDAAVLESFCQFVQSGSHTFGLEVTKRFHLPTEKFSQTLGNPPDNYRKHKVRYEFKKHGRMIQIKEVPVEKADIWLQFIQSNLPEGVNIQFELKKWQDFVSPPDPRIEEQRKLSILRKQGKLNEKSN